MRPSPSCLLISLSHPYTDAFDPSLSLVRSFNIESYLAIHGPALGATAHAAASASGSLPAQAAIVTVQIAGDDDEANELRRRAQEIEDKRNQNALPSWIAQSTISSAPEQQGVPAAAAQGEARDGVQGASSAARIGGATLRMGDGDSAGGGDRKPVLTGAHAGSDPAGAGTGDADLDAYYASLESGAAAGAAGEGPSGETGSATPALDGDDAYELDEELEGSPLLDSPGPGVSSGRAGTSEERQLGLEDEADEGTPGAADATSSKRERGGEDDDDLGAAASKRARRDEEEDRARSGEEVVGSAAAGGFGGDPGAVEQDDEDDDDEFDLDEGGEGGGDPNQLISVNGKEVPFSEVTEDMTGDMVRSSSSFSLSSSLERRTATDLCALSLADGRRVQRASLSPLPLLPRRRALTLSFRSQAYWEVYQQVNS